MYSAQVLLPNGTWFTVSNETYTTWEEAYLVAYNSAVRYNATSQRGIKL